MRAKYAHLRELFGDRYLVLLIAFAIFILLDAILANASIRGRLIESALGNQRRIHETTVASINRVFAQAESSILRFSGLVSYSSAELGTERESLSSILQKDRDGVWRSRYPGFDPDAEAAIWISPAENLAELDSGFYMRTRRLTTLVGQGAQNEVYLNTWVLPKANSEVIYFPDQGAFLASVTPDLDYRGTAWFLLSDPQTNPQGKPLWTPPLYDPPSKAWLISVIAPFYIDGVWAGSVGHDVHISSLIKALLEDRSGNPIGIATKFFAVTEDGRIIASNEALASETIELPGSIRALLDQPAASGPEARTVKVGQAYILESALSSLRLRIFYVLPESELMDKIRYDIFLFQGINTAVFALFLFFLVQNFLRAYQARQRHAVELANHNLELEAAITARTEELRIANTRLEALTRIDALTGLGNRRCFDQSLASAWNAARRRESPVALLMLDVDFFKRYNDHLGHQAGDDCLARIAKVLRKVVKRSEDVVARYGGEEFAIILPHTGTEGAIEVAVRLIEGMAEAAIPHPQGVTECVTLSIGVASSTPVGGLDPESLTEAADAALYRAKSAGRNQYAV